MRLGFGRPPCLGVRLALFYMTDMQREVPPLWALVVPPHPCVRHRGRGPPCRPQLSGWVHWADRHPTPVGHS